MSTVCFDEPWITLVNMSLLMTNDSEISIISWSKKYFNEYRRSMRVANYDPKKEEDTFLSRWKNWTFTVSMMNTHSHPGIYCCHHKSIALLSKTLESNDVTPIVIEVTSYKRSTMDFIAVQSNKTTGMRACILKQGTVIFWHIDNTLLTTGENKYTYISCIINGTYAISIARPNQRLPW